MMRKIMIQLLLIWTCASILAYGVVDRLNQPGASYFLIMAGITSLIAVTLWIAGDSKK